MSRFESFFYVLCFIVWDLLHPLIKHQTIVRSMWIRDLDAMSQRREKQINEDSSDHREVQGKIRVFSAFRISFTTVVTPLACARTAP